MPLENIGRPLLYPTIAGTCSGNLLVVASGRCVWEDLARFKLGNREDMPCIHFNGDVMAVNDIGMHLPCEVTHWYSNDWKMLKKWVDARRPRFQKIYDRHIETHSCFGGAKHVWPWPGNGTSTLSAVYTGLALGYESILIAGAPMDNSGHYFDPPWVETRFHNEVPNKDGQLKYWRDAKANIFDGRVKSLSGRTRELLG